jgi:hypothetical protein
MGRRHSFNKQIACARLIKFVKNFECLSQMPPPVRRRSRT